MNPPDINDLDNLRVVLDDFESDFIKVSQVIRFNGNILEFEGYDIGKRVEEAFGDSDYEYNFSVSTEEVKKFYPLFDLEPGDKKGLLLMIYEKFAGNHAYSSLCDFMRKNGIDFNGFTWT